jgi:hypothetical protein
MNTPERNSRFQTSLNIFAFVPTLIGTGMLLLFSKEFSKSLDKCGWIISGLAHLVLGIFLMGATRPKRPLGDMTRNLFHPFLFSTIGIFMALTWYNSPLAIPFLLVVIWTGWFIMETFFYYASCFGDWLEPIFLKWTTPNKENDLPS